MSDPVFLIAITGLGLSGIVSALRLIDWFLHTDAKALAQVWRLAAVGLFALALPLLFGLSVNQKWTEAIGLSAVMLLAFALYGPRVLAQMFPRRLAPDLSGRAAGYCGPDVATSEAETVQRAIAVLEEHLRRGASARQGTHLRLDRAPMSRANGNGRDDAHDDAHGSLPMSEAEALQVLGLGTDATEVEINESHRRLMQMIHPDRGGSAYFAVKVNQAKDALLGPGQSQRSRKTRPRRRGASRQDFSQSKPTTGG
jgi:hypothetical protein